MMGRRREQQVRADMENRMENVIRVYEAALDDERRTAARKTQQVADIARAARDGQSVTIMGVRYIPDPERHDTSA